MKVRLQNVVEYCSNYECERCRYSDKCIKMGDLLPCEYINYVELCKKFPRLAKALYTNEEIEL